MSFAGVLIIRQHLANQSNFVSEASEFVRSWDEFME